MEKRYKCATKDSSIKAETAMQPKPEMRRCHFKLANIKGIVLSKKQVSGNFPINRKLHLFVLVRYENRLYEVVVVYTFCPWHRND